MFLWWSVYCIHSINYCSSLFYFSQRINFHIYSEPKKVTSIKQDYYLYFNNNSKPNKNIRQSSHHRCEFHKNFTVRSSDIVLIHSMESKTNYVTDIIVAAAGVAWRKSASSSHIETDMKIYICWSTFQKFWAVIPRCYSWTKDVYLFLMIEIIKYCLISLGARTISYNREMKIDFVALRHKHIIRQNQHRLVKGVDTNVNFISFYTSEQ